VRKIRVLLADDHQLFREGVASILNAQSDFEIVGEASDGLEVLVMARALHPDLILMDIAMPGCDGVEATHLIKQELPETIIVILTVRDEDDALFEAIKGGAQGFLPKTIRSHELLALLRGAVHGEAAITPAMAGRMLEEFRRLSGQAHPTPEIGATALTGREQEVLGLIAQSATDQEIANTLTISIYTVKTHVRNILAKLHLSHRYEAAQYALRQGLLHRPPDKTAR
jgi:DNA-binding NarL/FixJ family response regulator